MKNRFPFANKTLADTPAGHLVLLIGHWSIAGYGIVGEISENGSTPLVMLDDDGPLLVEEKQQAQVRVLDYGADWILDPDPAGPFESRPQYLFESPGCIISIGEQLLLNIRDRSWPHRRVQFDLVSYRLVSNYEINGIATFGRWSIYLGDHSAPENSWRRIGGFEWKEPATQ